jgi:hypothetical protein
VDTGSLPEATVGFRSTRDDVWQPNPGKLIRVIYEVSLGEISLAASGAVPGTRSVALGVGAARLNVAAAMRADSFTSALLFAEIDARTDRIAALTERRRDYASPQHATLSDITFSTTGRIAHIA